MRITVGLGLLLASAGIGEAVKVNPLPAPTSITWGTSGSIPFSGTFKLNGSPNSIIVAAWNRAFSTITTLQWVPQATEAPIATYAPFPTTIAKIKRNSSPTILNTVDLHVGNGFVDLHD
jgi:hexosaminidase